LGIKQANLKNRHTCRRQIKKLKFGPKIKIFKKIVGSYVMFSLKIIKFVV
jgi:hypothetical protein